MLQKIALFLIFASLSPLCFSKSLIENKQAQEFIYYMVKKHQYNPKTLKTLFSKMHYNPVVIEKISTPAEKWPWEKYQKHFLTPKRIAGGVAFWQQYKTPLEMAEKKFGVPPELIVAIIGVESFYGQHKGQFNVLEALGTLAFHYPKRAEFFKKELEEFLLLTREENFQPDTMTGSYAGAMGIPQFIASSYRAYALDFSESGQKNIIDNPINAIGSVANYFKRHGWQSKLPVVSRAIVKPNAKLPEYAPGANPKPAYTPKSLVEASVYQGSYPELVKRNYQYAKIWYDSYLNTYLEKDLRTLTEVGNIRDFNRLIQLLASQVSQTLNFSNFARDLGVTVPTVKRWISVLEASYIIFLLPPYVANHKKQITKSPKIYFYDTGLVAYLTKILTQDHFEKGPLKGPLFENYIVSEVKKNNFHRFLNHSVSFYRSKAGVEVDLIIETPEVKQFIEIKYNQTFHPKMLSGVKQLMRQEDEGYLVYCGQNRKFDDRIRVLNYQDFLQLLLR